ncbi:MAG: type II secretion system secretin GspD [Caulobacter sp.]|nr:type II secretion system secretin GspD [Caulobacter sp.]
MRLVTFAALAAALCAAPLADARAQTQTLNVQDADIRAFIQDVSRSTGYTFVIDPRVKGVVSVSSSGPLSRAELFDVFLSTLRANNFVAVPTGSGAYRIEPSENAARQPSAAGGQFTTQVFRLRSIDAQAAAEILKPLVGPQGQVIANPRGNTLVVADYADNVRRIRGLITQIDQDRSSTRAVTLRNSSAREVAAVITNLTALSGADGKPTRGPVSVVAVEGSNTVLLRGEPEAIDRLLPLIADLDLRARSNDDVKVIFLKHANAEQMLPVLQQLLGLPVAGAGPASADGTRATAEAAVQPAGGLRVGIARYPGANALIISAPPDTQRMLAEVITKLDVRREQVLVEAIVVEVSDNAARELGVQFILGGGKGDVPFAVTNYSNTAPNILALAGAVAGEKNLPEDSATLAALRDAAVSSLLGANGLLTGGVGQLENGAIFGVIVNAVRRDSGSRLLSTPSVLTLDNEEATFLVGQEVPITTGEVLGSANNNPFRTIQRQNVGIQLEVKPRINAGGGITLFLRQEVSSVAGPVAEGSSELILNKRELETTVLVDDGQIVVLGGLLDENERTSVNAVPGLSEIPVLGGLFKSKARTGGRTNLMIFIRPRIIRSAADAQAVTAPRYDFIRGDPALVDRSGVNALDALVQDYLKTLPPVAPPPATSPAATPIAAQPLPPPSATELRGGPR